MSSPDNVNEIPVNVNNNFETEERMRKLKEELSKCFEDYQKTMKYMAADAPIEILCLPKVIETCLFNHGCLRVYDIFDLDFTEVKGLGEIRIRQLTTCLNQFLSML
jgi:hypothetical protein